MTKNRLEAFSDGVLAIVVTIMVLELKVPHEASMHALFELAPLFISYLLSFVFVAIYWVNHHHLLHAVHHVNSKIIWANMHLLFWLSLIPFTTAWIGENVSEKLPVAIYGTVLLFCGIAYNILHKAVLSHYSHSVELTNALKKHDKKGKLSLVLYLISIPLAFLMPLIAEAVFVFVAIMWISPDKNIEKALSD